MSLTCNTCLAPRYLLLKGFALLNQCYYNSPAGRSAGASKMGCPRSSLLIRSTITWLSFTQSTASSLGAHKHCPLYPDFIMSAIVCTNQGSACALHSERVLLLPHC